MAPYFESKLPLSVLDWHEMSLAEACEKTDLCFMQLLLHQVLSLLSSISKGQGFCQSCFQPAHLIAVPPAVLC